MEEKIQKLFLIDNAFFNKIPNTNELLDSLLSSFTQENVSVLLENSEIIYVNNGNTTWDKKVAEHKIKTINSIGEIDFLKYDTVLYSNSPFFSIAIVFGDFVSNDKLPTNTILTQDGYNLSPIVKAPHDRFLFVKGKPNQRCNVSSLSLFVFKPKQIDDVEYKFETQKELVQMLHRENPLVTLNFSNVGGLSPFTFFDTEIEYIKYCLPTDSERQEITGTVGTYVISFPKDLSLDEIKSLVIELLDNNKKIVLDIRTPHDISGIFEEEIKEVDGEFIVENAFEGDVSRIITTNKDLLHYDFNTVNGLIDLSDMHIRHLIMGTSKYMKVYNSKYTMLYKIEKGDLEKSKKIAVKRTMGMGDALLALPIISMMKKEYPHLEIDFYSKYDFRPYLKDSSIISNFHMLDDKGIFSHIEDRSYDIVLDLDLAYENQTKGGRFFDCYMSLFGKDVFPDRNIENILEVTAKDLGKVCTIVAEGSGWGGKEPNIDVLERIAYEMKKKGFTISEPGINRITNFADLTNPDKDIYQLFLRVAESDCYIGTDSGVSHIANMMGKPCFIIGGSADPMKTQYNLSLVYPVGRTDLLCYGCRHHFKGFRTLENGVNTFVAPCHNQKQYECMKTLDIELIVEELDNFLIKHDLSEKSENSIDSKE